MITVPPTTDGVAIYHQTGISDTATIGTGCCADGGKQYGREQITHGFPSWTKTVADNRFPKALRHFKTADDFAETVIFKLLMLY
jgi:hypothetical protein